MDNEEQEQESKDHNRSSLWLFQLPEIKTMNINWQEDSDKEEEEEAMQTAIFLSQLQISQQEKQKDTKEKGIIRPCTLTPLAFFDTFDSTKEVGSTSCPATCLLCRDIIVSPVHLTPCDHMFCKECISDYVTKNLKDDINSVNCPGPGCNLDLIKLIQYWVPEEVGDRWREAKIEGSVLAYPIFIKCPMEGCGRQIVDDERGYQIRACTSCWKIFCYICKAGWHMGMTCEEYRRREEIARIRILMIRQKREQEMEEKKITRKTTTLYMEDNGGEWYEVVMEEEKLLSYIRKGLIISTGAGLRFAFSLSDLRDTD